MFNRIVILDFGSQLTKLIARRVRELNFYSTIENFDIKAEAIKKLNAKAIIISGGPASVVGDNAPQIDSEIFNLNIPVFGICYGQQLIASNFGAKVLPSSKREFGKAFISFKKDHSLLEGYSENQTQQVWMSHGDKIEELPEGFEIIAESDNMIMALKHKNKPMYGVQFHPESIKTENGLKIIENFLKL